MSNFKIKIFLFSGFIIIIMGFFTPLNFIFADSPDDPGTCVTQSTNIFGGPSTITTYTKRKDCTGPKQRFSPNSAGVQGAEAVTSQVQADGEAAAKAKAEANSYYQPQAKDSFYHLLAPFPDNTDFDTAGTNTFGRYLNIMIDILIGLAGVAAVVMMVMGGIEYMTSELMNTKEHGRSMMTNAILGIIMALGAYTILYTINPTLLVTDFEIGDVHLQYINSFQASGSLTRSGSPVNINFTEAYPAAVAAAAQTHLDPALILAVFAQETGGGVNTGRCTPSDARMSPADQAALPQVVGAANVATTNMSCPGADPKGHGGALGLMQILPSTWLEFRDNPNRDPWNLNDAFAVAARKLAANGGATNPGQAACSYFGQCSFGGVNYQADILARMDTIKKQIEDGIKKGTLK
jgi:hypothetical protein